VAYHDIKMERRMVAKRRNLEGITENDRKQTFN
jgi:hypothetical protein